jgi:hypothetical protein
VTNPFHRDPEPTFADLYRPMSELELENLAADRHSLIPALAAEFATRNPDFTEPPPPADDAVPEFRELVTIRRYRDLSEAIVARAVIESTGIFYFLKDENLVRLDWQVSNFIGGIRLQVDAVDVEAAEAILSLNPFRASSPSLTSLASSSLAVPAAPPPTSCGNARGARPPSPRSTSSRFRCHEVVSPGIATFAACVGRTTNSPALLCERKIDYNLA